MKKKDAAGIEITVENQSYSNISQVFLPVSLTALILILDHKDLIHDHQKEIPKIIILFFTSFAGFIASAFAFAVNSRFKTNSNLQNAKNFILGNATAIPVILLFTGLFSLIEVMVEEPSPALSFNTAILVFAILMAPTFTVATGPTRWWNSYEVPRPTSHLDLYALAYAPIVLAFIYKWCYWDEVVSDRLFYFTTGALFVLLVVGDLWKAIVDGYEFRDEDYQVQYIYASLWIIIHSVCFSGLLFIY